MQCQICKNNEATIHLTEISDGVRSELHLCEYCAAEQQIAAKNQLPLNELLSSLLAAVPEDETISVSTEQGRLKCPACGFTLENLRNQDNSGLMGCPLDYEVFEKAMLPLIESVQNGKSYHCGKTPSSIPKRAKDQIELFNLKGQLEEAVRKEDYELAARLRDQIAQKEKSS
jgi:protein arginine kinase activator